jgi:hypothetical protein
VHAWARWLLLDDSSLGSERLVPPFLNELGRLDLLGELDEGQEMSMLAGPEPPVEPGQLQVVAVVGQQLESLA